MKFGFRIPSLKKKISSNLSITKALRSKFRMPKGYALITSPRKSIYNRIYNRVSMTFNSIFELFFGS